MLRLFRQSKEHTEALIPSSNYKVHLEDDLMYIEDLANNKTVLMVVTVDDNDDKAG